MMRLLRDLRIVPLVLVASIGLFALKTLGLVLEGGYTTTTASTTTERPAEASAVSAAKPATPVKTSWAQEMLGFPARDASGPGDAARVTQLALDTSGASDITGSVGETKPAAPKPAPAPPPSADAKGDAKGDAKAGDGKAGEGKAGEGKAGDAKAGDVKEAKADAKAGGRPQEMARLPSLAERALLERLQERRGELEEREREVDMRENLLKAAEKRLEERLNELKTVEGRINESMQKKDEAEATRFKSLIAMYENMKAKEAARIFDRLDLRVLLDVSSQLNPRRMSDILAQMSPEAAEKLTVELANRFSGKDKAASAAAAPALLPKIEGKPTN